MKTLSHRMAVMGDSRGANAIREIFTDIYERMRCVMLSSAGLVIKAGGSTLVKTGASACQLAVGGLIRSIAASTDMPALVGTVTNAKFNVFVFTVGKDGTTYVAMGTEAATLAAVKWPTLPTNRTIIGFIIVNPTGTGNFVGGTTALDDVTVVPNVVYVNPLGAFDPNAPLQ